MTRKRKATTLVEVAIMVIILATLAYLAAVKSSSVVEIGGKNGAMTDAASIHAAISRYKFKNGSYPVNQQALVSSGLLPALPTADPYGTNNCGVNGTAGGATAYCYAYNATSFRVWSAGPNKANNSGGGGGSTPPATLGGDDVGP